MSKLDTKIIAYLGREPDFNTEVKLQDDTVDGISSPYISEWNISSEKPKPTLLELDSFESEAQAIIDNAINKKTTDKANANAKLKALGLTDDEIEAIKS